MNCLLNEELYTACTVHYSEQSDDKENWITLLLFAWLLHVILESTAADKIIELY